MSEYEGSLARRQDPARRYSQGELALSHGPEHFDALHREAHGTVLVWEALKRKNRWTKLRPDDPKIPSFLKSLEGREDTYISVNEFDGWRLVRLLRSLRAFYVDLDDVRHLQEVYDVLDDWLLPPPSLVVYSGQGMHLYWLLEAVPPQALPLWQRVQDALIKAFEELGADYRAKDCTRVLRLVGTVNSKNQAEVRGLIVTGLRWTLRELANEVLGYRNPRRSRKIVDLNAQAAKRGKKPSRKLTGSIYQRWYLVYQDLLKIARHHGQIPKGHRHDWLFLSSVALSWFSRAEALCHEIDDALKNFVPGLSSGEVSGMAKEIQRRAELAAAGEKIEWGGEMVDPRYRLRRASLYKRLKLIIPDELLPDLRAVIPDRLAAERKKERDQARWSDHYTGDGVRVSNEDKRTSARLMRSQGKSLRVIGRELGVSHEIVRRWCL